LTYRRDFLVRGALKVKSLDSGFRIRDEARAGEFFSGINIGNRLWTKIQFTRGTGRVHERALMAGADCKLKPPPDRNNSSG